MKTDHEKMIKSIAENTVKAIKVNQRLKTISSALGSGYALSKRLIDFAGLDPTKIISEVNELFDTSGNLERVQHVTSTGVKHLNQSSDIIAALTGGLDLFIVGSQCLLKWRSPSAFERAKMFYSSIILTLGLLAFTGVGGPVAIAAFSASIIFLSFTKTISVMIRDSFRLKNAKIAHEKACDTQNVLIERIVQLLEETKQIKDSQKNEAHNDLQLQAKLDENTERLAELNTELINQNKAVVRTYYKQKILESTHEGHLDKIRKVLIIGGGILSVIGAAMSLTPLAPAGLMLIAIGASISLFTSVGFEIKGYFDKRRLKKIEAEKLALFEQSTNKGESVPLSDALILKGLTENTNLSDTSKTKTPAAHESIAPATMEEKLPAKIEARVEVINPESSTIRMNK